VAEKLYLLTGASGFLGGNILSQLVTKGEKVRVLMSPNNPAISRMPEGTEIVIGNLLDKDSLQRFFTVTADEELIVIHSAGIITMETRANKNVYQVNVGGTRNIVEKCIQHKVKKLVYISSTSAIVELPHGQKIKEEKEHNPDLVFGYYSKTKAMASNIVLEAAANSGLDASVIYPSGIFGPNDYRLGLITRSVKMVAKGRLPLSLEGTFNSVDVRDLVAGVIACSERGGRGETYIMANETYTFNQLIAMIFEEMGIKRRLLTLPLWLIHPFAYVGLIYTKLTKRPAYFNRFSAYNFARNNEFSSEKATRELGFKSRPLNETIADTIEWLREVGELKG
jgi:dihydroflavonol-4-reductase